MKFRRRDWVRGTTIQTLREELENYYIEFQLELYGGWTERDIRSFLHINFHMIPKRITPAHVKQIAKIIKEMIA